MIRSSSNSLQKRFQCLLIRKGTASYYPSSIVHDHCMQQRLPKSQQTQLQQRKRFLFNNALTQSAILRRHSTHDQIQKSCFHQTSKREILPLIGAATLLFIGRYSYKALVRMDEEWEDYQKALIDGGYASSSSSSSSSTDTNLSSNSSSTTTNLFLGGTMGIDLGSYNLRISHIPKQKTNHHQHGLSNNDGRRPVIIENREGARSTPALTVLNPESSNNDQDSELLLGTMAKSKLYERTMYTNLPPIQFIRDQLSSSNEDEDEENREQFDSMNDNVMVRNTNFFLSTVTSNALEKAIGTKQHPSHVIGRDPLFSIDAATVGGKSVRPVFTYNPSMTKLAKQRYQSAVQMLTSPPSMTAFVPEPIAAVIGATNYKILTFSPSQKSPVAVLDVGGHVLSLSIIEPDMSKPYSYKMLYHSSISNTAGYALQKALVNILIKDFFNSSSSTSLPPPDGMALQRLYDASEMAVMELSQHTRTNINIPYITVDTKTMQPKHLDMGISRTVLQNELDAIISQEFSTFTSTEPATTASSSSTYSIPVKDLSSLITNMFLQSMEKTNLNPFVLDGILLVGGGARSPIFQQGVKEGLVGLGGEAFADEKLFIPKGEFMEELVVLGAALCEDYANNNNNDNGGDGKKMEPSHLMEEDWS